MDHKQIAQTEQPASKTIWANETPLRTSQTNSTSNVTHMPERPWAESQLSVSGLDLCQLETLRATERRIGDGAVVVDLSSVCPELELGAWTTWGSLEAGFWPKTSALGSST